MSDSDRSPVAGTMIGPYRIVREIGGGGMGIVYEAADDALNRTVALKIISPHLAADEAFRERFTREAQALAALDSPQVVHVYSHGEVDGQLYLATQLIPDGDLGAMLHDYGAPPLRVGLDLIAQVAAGLADSHDAGMIHRDIKPANILLRRRGNTMSAYLGDFGIARNLDVDSTHASKTGTVGTPSYMAPELHTGGRAGVASDIYAVGCLLWAVLSGHAPYRGTTEYQIVSAHLEAPVPQLPGGSELVTEVNRILRTAMAKDPAERYSSAARLRDDLRRTRALPTTGARRGSDPSGAGAPRRTPLLIALGVLVAVLVLAAVVWGASGDGQDDPGPPAPTSSTPLLPTGPPTSEPTTPSAEGATDGSTPGAPSTASAQQRATAVASLTDALADQGLLSRDQAECAAREWIDRAGLDQMVAEGLFDADYSFVDIPAAQMSPATRTAAATATLTCATS